MTARSLWRIGLALLAAAAVVAVVVVVAGGGSDPEGSDAPQRSAAADAERTAATKGSPRALAENAGQANELVDGGRDALEAKLAALEGHPVVVNQWGSWCPPCRAEFPVLRRVGAGAP